MSTIALDWDGTLLDSRLRHRKALADVLRFNRVAACRETLDDFVPFKAEGRTTVDYLNARFPSLSDPWAIAREWVGKIELPQYLCLDELYSDSSDVLARLSRGYRLILVSARQNRAALVDQVARLGVAEYFEQIICVNPGPDAGMSKARALRSCRADSIFSVIGDTEVDEECAQLVSADFYAISRGFRSARWWKRRGRNPFESLTEVSKILWEIQGLR